MVVVKIGWMSWLMMGDGLLVSSSWTACSGVVCWLLHGRAMSHCITAPAAPQAVQRWVDGGRDG